MGKHSYENEYKDGKVIKRIRIERKETLIAKIKKAGNWKFSMRKLTTKYLTSYCGVKEN